MLPWWLLVTWDSELLQVMFLVFLSMSLSIETSFGRDDLCSLASKGKPQKIKRFLWDDVFFGFFLVSSV